MKFIYILIGTIISFYCLFLIEGCLYKKQASNDVVLDTINVGVLNHQVYILTTSNDYIANKFIKSLDSLESTDSKKGITFDMGEGKIYVWVSNDTVAYHELSHASTYILTNVGINNDELRARLNEYLITEYKQKWRNQKN